MSCLSTIRGRGVTAEVVVGAVAAAPEAAAVEVAEQAEVVELAEGVEQAEVVELAEGAEQAEGAELAGVAVLVEAEVEAEQAPVAVTAEVEEEVLRQSGPGASPETRGLPETPRPGSAWHRREHSPSAGCHPCLSSG